MQLSSSSVSSDPAPLALFPGAAATAHGTASGGATGDRTADGFAQFLDPLGPTSAPDAGALGSGNAAHGVQPALIPGLTWSPVVVTDGPGSGARDNKEWAPTLAEGDGGVGDSSDAELAGPGEDEPFAAETDLPTAKDHQPGRTGSRGRGTHAGVSDEEVLAGCVPACPLPQAPVPVALPLDKTLSPAVETAGSAETTGDTAKAGLPHPLRTATRAFPHWAAQKTAEPFTSSVSDRFPNRETQTAAGEGAEAGLGPFVREVTAALPTFSGKAAPAQLEPHSAEVNASLSEQRPTEAPLPRWYTAAPAAMPSWRQEAGRLISAETPRAGVTFDADGNSEAAAENPVAFVPGVRGQIRPDAEVRPAAELPLPGRRLETKANFAGRGEAAAATLSMGETGAKKSFLKTEEQVVTSDRKSFGIDGAKPKPAMFTADRTLPISHPGSEYAGSAVTAADTVAEALPLEAGPVDQISSAHEAVEVVLHAVEHVANREQKSVNLKFSVGDAELSVRVEMHANEVRTTFRTDSSDLRAALSHEWQNVASSTPTDRATRLAPPVFSAGEQSAFNSASGDPSSRQRDPGARPTEGERLTAAIRSRRGPAQPAPVENVPTVSAPAVRSSRRLHVHA